MKNVPGSVFLVFQGWKLHEEEFRPANQKLEDKTTNQFYQSKHKREQTTLHTTVRPHLVFSCYEKALFAYFLTLRSESKCPRGISAKVKI